jgi:putative phosphoribosyl transferase
VAQQLQEAGYATLLFDLLTLQEDRDYTNRFDIAALTSRLLAITEWLKRDPRTEKINMGYFGASTGAAAALKAAATLGHLIRAVVSRGGRPDMARSFLQQVKSPTLLIVGSLDEEVIKLNEQAYAALNVEKEIKIVPGAGHLFEEPGNLEEVAALSIRWFNKHLS